MKIESRIFLIALGMVLSLGIFASGTQTFAQDGINESETTLSQPGTVINQTDQNGGVTRVENAFNPMWLLPLIAIPLLLYMLWPKNKHSNALSTQELAGSKGGRAEEDSDELLDSDIGRERRERV